MLPIIPKPVYPVAIDDSRNLFVVYNNTQSVLANLLDADANTIEIVPCSANSPEVWPDNGFATLPGELIYYDEVERDINGKVKTLLRCARAVEGEATTYTEGTPIYGYVVAQQHNQLADAIIKIEETIGNITEYLGDVPNSNLLRQSTGFSLNSSLTSMLGVSSAVDDACPEIDFEFNVGVPIAGGTTAEFCVRIFPWNPETMTYQLDFGDGNITTTEFSGTHSYGAGGPYTPEVTVVTSNCTIVQKPSTLEAGFDLSPSISNPIQPFHVEIPEIPEFPSFISPNKICPGPLLNLPPILIQQASICSTASVIPISLTVTCWQPSEISIVGCCPPSLISIQCCELPSVISMIGSCEIPSIVSFAGFNVPSSIIIEGCCPPSEISIVGCCVPSFISVTGCDIPSEISLTGCNIPSEISITCCNIPSEISFTNCCIIPSEITFLGVKDLPSVISFVGCDLPSLISLVGPSSILLDIPSKISIDCCDLPSRISIDCCDIPSSIIIEVPSNFNIPSKISIDCCEIPSVIKLEGPSTIKLDAPSLISVVGCNFPDVISITGCNLPTRISVDCCDMPNVISVTGCDIPRSISFVGCDLPNAISVVGCNFPSKITVECCDLPSVISVVGCQIPSSITLDCNNCPNVISVDWGTPPTVSVVIQCPSSTGSVNMGMAAVEEQDFDNSIPVEFNGIGIPEEIKIIAPDIRIKHDIPTEIAVKIPELRDIRIIGPDIPQEISLVGTIPNKIHVIATDIPSSIKLDVSDLPGKIFLEVAPDFPTTIKLQAVGIPDVLQVTGIPQVIEVIGNIPSTIQLLMPENPTVELVWKGAPLELRAHPDLEKTLSKIMIVN